MNTTAHINQSTTPASGASKFAPLFVAYVRLYAAIFQCRFGACYHTYNPGYCDVYQFLIEVDNNQTKTI